MRHRVSGKKLGRDLDHRKALLNNLSASLIEHGSVETTLAKAKYLRPYVEKLVTRAKRKDFNSIKYIRGKLPGDHLARKLFDEIAPGFSSRDGGYTRIVRLGSRTGDRAKLARIEWVEGAKKESEDKKTSKGRKGKTKGAGKKESVNKKPKSSGKGKKKGKKDE